jgi:hypothetical protein
MMLRKDLQKFHLLSLKPAEKTQVKSILFAIKKSSLKN